MEKLLHLLRSDDGAITVDWVVLTAAILLLGILISLATFGGLREATEHLASYVASSVANAGQP
ncbi:hypothetical protein [Rhodobacter sp. NSM]|uniref:hypothetical protein n=1 Tax=Rhodobacter sp. NSM TaxID=3457501 RepID=UPI003FD01BCD